MAKFIIPANPIDINSVNDGNEYIDGDGLQADAINNTILAAFYAQDKAHDAAEKLKDVAQFVDDAVKNAITNMIYPVGSYFITEEKDEPASIFGGSWVIVQDRFLYGVSNSVNAGTVSGASSHKHTQTGSETSGNTLYAGIYPVPSSGYVDFGDNYGAGNVTYTTYLRQSGVSVSQQSHVGGVKVYGSTAEANHMPPYRTVHIWRRVE